MSATDRSASGGAARAARLPRPSLLRPRRPGDRRRRLRRAARRAAGDRARPPGAAARRTRRRSASAAEPVSSCEKVRHLRRCSRSPTPARRRSCAPGWRACAPTWRARASRTRTSASSPSRRSTAWRSRSSTATACSSAARRAATARSARTSPTTCARSPRSRSRIDGRAAAARGPRRGLHVAAGLRRAQRAPRGGGPVDLHEPAQLARPARSASSTRRSPPSGRCRCGATASAPPRGSRSARTGRRWSGCARTASGSTTTSGGSTPRTRSSAQCLAWQERRGALDFEIDGVVVKVDDVELQRRLGVVGPRPALGDRVEVPADDRGDDAARRSVERRQVRRPAPVRRAGAGARRRRDGQDGDAAQRGGPRAQGRPRRRRGDRAARGRRDPAGACPRPRTRSSARTARRRRARPSGARSAARRPSSPRARCSQAARTATARSAAGSC